MEKDYRKTIEHDDRTSDPIGRIVAVVLLIAIITVVASCTNSILYGEW